MCRITDYQSVPALVAPRIQRIEDGVLRLHSVRRQLHQPLHPIVIDSQFPML